MCIHSHTYTKTKRFEAALMFISQVLCPRSKTLFKKLHKHEASSYHRNTHEINSAFSGCKN